MGITFLPLQALTGYDLVVNCTGLGAAELFGDTSMFPIKGHVIRVQAPWIKAIYFVSSGRHRAYSSIPAIGCIV